MPTLGLSMIVRNAEKDLGPCLDSARPLVEQIVVADTGSTDRSREIAAGYGAVVVSFPWTDHFAEARNAALTPMTTDWVLVLDADEELAPEAGKAIPKLLGTSAGMGGYQVTIRNYIRERFAMTFERMSRVNHDRAARAGDAPAYTEHAMVRLFRRHPEIRFARRIHEGVDEQVLALGLRIGQANFRIRHFGHLAREEERERKREYYLELGRRKAAEQPHNALGWLELGSEYFNAGRYDEALDCMQRCVAIEPWALAVLYIARIHAAEGRRERALAALGMVPDHRDLALLRNELRGDLLHDMKRLKEARTAYRTALRFSPARMGHDGCGREGNIESKLGYTEVRLGMVRMGLARMRRAIAEMPDLIDNHDRLVKALAGLGRDEEAAEASDEILKYFLSEKIVLRAAALRLRLGQWARADEILRRGLRCFPASAELGRMLAGARQGTDAAEERVEDNPAPAAEGLPSSPS